MLRGCGARIIARKGRGVRLALFSLFLAVLYFCSLPYVAYLVGRDMYDQTGSMVETGLACYSAPFNVLDRAGLLPDWYVTSCHDQLKRGQQMALKEKDDLHIAALSGSVWHVSSPKWDEKIMGGKFRQHSLVLNGDRRVGYRYSPERPFDYIKSPAQWSVTSGNLIISWKHGDVEAYNIRGAPGKTYKGLNRRNIELVLTAAEADKERSVHQAEANR